MQSDTPAATGFSPSDWIRVGIPCALITTALACGGRPVEKTVDSVIHNESTAPPSEMREGETWWLGDDDAVSGKRHRFVAEMMNDPSGAGYIRLDSVIHRPGIDSFVTAARVEFRVGRREKASRGCRSPRSAAGPVVGIVPDTTPDLSLPASAAWVIDTAALSIRPVSTDSTVCTVPHGE